MLAPLRLHCCCEVRVSSLVFATKFECQMVFLRHCAAVACHLLFQPLRRLRVILFSAPTAASAAVKFERHLFSQPSSSLLLNPPSPSPCRHNCCEVEVSSRFSSPPCAGTAAARFARHLFCLPFCAATAAAKGCFSELLEKFLVRLGHSSRGRHAPQGLLLSCHKGGPAGFPAGITLITICSHCACCTDTRAGYGRCLVW